MALPIRIVLPMLIVLYTMLYKAHRAQSDTDKFHCCSITSFKLKEKMCTAFTREFFWVNPIEINEVPKEYPIMKP